MALNEAPRIVKSIETESRRGWGEQRMESLCLMGTEFVFGKMKSSKDG